MTGGVGKLNVYPVSGDIQAILDQAAQANPNDGDYINAVVLYMIEVEAKDSALQFLNHPSPSVRASVEIAISDWRTPQAAIIQECPLAALGREQLIRCWIVDDAGDHLAFAF